MTAAGLQVVDIASAEPRDWDNGGGTTRDLLRWPEGDDWWLRISVADIASDGPFSRYPGVDRWFAVLEGAGVELSWRKAVRHLHAGHSLLHFDGKLAPDCQLALDTVRALNIMHRRGRGRVSAEPARNGSLPPQDHERFALFTLDPARLRGGESVLARLEPWSLVHGEKVDAVLDIQRHAHAWWIGFTPT